MPNPPLLTTYSSHGQSEPSWQSTRAIPHGPIVSPGELNRNEYEERSRERNSKPRVEVEENKKSLRIVSLYINGEAINPRSHPDTDSGALPRNFLGK